MRWAGFAALLVGVVWFGSMDRPAVAQTKARWGFGQTTGQDQTIGNTQALAFSCDVFGPPNGQATVHWYVEADGTGEYAQMVDSRNVTLSGDLGAGYGGTIVNFYGENPAQAGQVSIPRATNGWTCFAYVVSGSGEAWSNPVWVPLE